MGAIKHCTDPRCQRDIPEEIFGKATAHALGCHVRRSLAQKEAHAKHAAASERSRRAAATRAARAAGADLNRVLGQLGVPLDDGRHEPYLRDA